MAEILEITMIVCFGISWPINLIKAYKARTAKGASPWFYIMVLIGYIAGITSKFLNPVYMASFSEKWYVLIFYFFNFFMVTATLCVYFRNKKLDERKDAVK